MNTNLNTHKNTIKSGQTPPTAPPATVWANGGNAHHSFRKRSDDW